MPLGSPRYSSFRRRLSRHQTKVEATQFSYFWTISKFRFCRKYGEKLTSSAFVVESANLTTKWCLELYPNGEHKKDEGYVSVVLILLEPKQVDMTVNFTFSIVNAKGKRTNITKWDDTKYFGEGHLGFVRFIKFDQLMSKASELLPKYTFTLCCDLTIMINPTKMIPGPDDCIDLKAEGGVCEDLRALLESKMLSDVTLLVQKKKIRAHKFILAARSPVFSAMFQNDMKENKDNVVKITDIDVETFENVLIYIYSGKMATLQNNHQLQDILYVASKYALDQLKTMCEVAISKVMTIPSAAEILVTADLHEANILKDSATDYILSHSEDVLATEGWKLLEESHPEIAIKIFRALLKRLENQ